MTAPAPQEHGFPLFAERNPDAPAIIESSGRRVSRGELYRSANQIAHALRAEGMRQGQVLAILSPNCVEFVASYLAAVDIGLYVIPINWHLSAPEIRYILENSEVAVLLAHERLAPLIQRVFEVGGSASVRRFSFGHIAGSTPLAELAAAQPICRVPDPTPGRVMMYTSATTGLPKAIKLPIGDANLVLARTIAFHNSCGIAFEDDNVHLCASVLYHAAPLEFVAIALHMGHSVVLVDHWEPESLLRLIDEHRATTSFMVPSMFVRLLKLPLATRGRYNVRSLRLVSHSAAPCPRDVKKQMMDWWGPVLWEGYGAAEGQGTVVGPREWLERPGTVGRAIPGSMLRVLDDQGNELPPHAAGTIYFSRFTGDKFEYRGDADKTRAAYCGDLFTVGDIGYLDEDGYLYLCDRKIDMIISGGMNIYSAEVEQILIQHPKVLDCAVFGVPDDLLGEAVRAAVQLCGGERETPELTLEINSFLRERLSIAKLPRKIEYVSALPRDPNGKLYKRLLREKYWAGRGRAI